MINENNKIIYQMLISVKYNKVLDVNICSNTKFGG